jgi:tetratricopeptide (TPR) repeat protein
VAGKNVRITVQLINAVSGFHIWSQTYDRKLTDILKLQTEVATAVAQQLETKLIGDETTKIELGGTEMPQAYDAYLRGIQLSYLPDAHEKEYRLALDAFDQAITLDPNYAAAYARRAGTLMRIYDDGHDERIRARLHSSARQAAMRAVALAPRLGDAHLALAFTLVLGDPHFVAASRELDLAVALSPGSAWVQRNYAEVAAAFRHFDSALAAAHQAVRLDPQNAWSYGTLGEVLTYARRFPEALTALNAGMVVEPNSRALEADTAFALLALGQYENARQLCQADSTPLEDDDRHSCLALALRGLQHGVDARRELEKLEDLQVDGGAYQYAAFYAQWGDRNTALQWLTKAARLRDPKLIYMQADWMLDPIRNEPQFKALESRMNFPP